MAEMALQSAGFSRDWLEMGKLGLFDDFAVILRGEFLGYFLGV